MKFLLSRKVLLACLIVSLGILISGCGTPNTSSDKQAEKETAEESKTPAEPFRVGVILPFTGPYAQLAKTQEYGMRVFLDSVNYKAAGRNIELIVEDTQLNPQVGLQKVRKLVEKDQIDLLTGAVSSDVAYAVRDYVVSQKIPFIISNAGATGLTRDKRSEYLFRVSFANGQYVGVLGPYAYKELGLKKMIVVASDYAAGHEKTQGFMDAFKEAGGEIVGEIYAPLGTSDFGAYLTKINPNEADGVFAFVVGGDGLRFVRQYDEFGLKAKLPLIGDGGLVSEDIIEALGDSPIGLITSVNYSSFIDSAENKSFVAAYEQTAKQRPPFYAYQGYLAARVLVEALEQVKGRTEDKPAFLKAIKEIQFTGPGGKFKFDPQTQNVIFDALIMKTEKVNSKVQNTIIKVIPKTADRWTP